MIGSPFAEYRMLFLWTYSNYLTYPSITGGLDSGTRVLNYNTLLGFETQPARRTEIEIRGRLSRDRAVIKN